MAQDDKIKALYDQLKNDGYQLDDENTFRQDLKDDSSFREMIYNAQKNDGYDMGGDFGAWQNRLMSNFGGQDNKANSNDITQTATKSNVGIAAQQVVDEYDRSVAENSNNTPLSTPQQERQPVQSQESTPRAQFVPEYANVKGFTVAKDSPLRQQYPFLDQLNEDEQAYFRTDTNEPLYAWKDSEGKDITPDEAATLNQRADIEQNDAIRPRQAPVTSLQLPEEVKSSGIRTDKKVSEYADELLKQQYGDGYLGKIFTDENGNEISGEELRNNLAQETYNALTDDIRKARIALFEAGGDKEAEAEINTGMANKWQGVMSDKRMLETLHDENAMKQDVKDYAQGEIDKAREEERRIIEEMNKRGAELDAASSPYVDQTFNIRQVDNRYTFLTTELNAVRDRIRSWEAVRDSDDYGAMRALKDTAGNLRSWDLGYSEMIKGMHLVFGTEQDKKELANLLGNAERAKNFEQKAISDFARYVQIGGQSLPFMATFVASGGGFRTLSEGVAKGAVKWAERKALQGIQKNAVKYLGVAAGDILAGYTLSGTLQGMGTLGDIMQRKAGDIEYNTEKGEYELVNPRGWAESAYKGATASMIDNATELLGDHLNIGKAAMKLLPKAGLKQVSDWLTKAGKSELYTTTREWLKRAGINGLGGEILEEEMAIPMNAVFVGDNPLLFGDGGLLDAKTQKDIVFGVGLSVFAMNAAAVSLHGAGQGINALQKMFDKDQRRLDVADNAAIEIIGGHKWTEIKNEIDNATNEELADVAQKIADDKELSEEQKKAVGEYVTNTLQMRGHNLGENAAMQSNEQRDAYLDSVLSPEERQNVHDDGMIHAAVLYPTAENNGQPQEVFITKGNIVMNADGTINAEASDKEIYYKGADGQAHITSPDKFQSVAQPINVEEYAAANAPQEAQAGYTPGQQVSVNIDGQDIQGEVTNVGEDGNVLVSFENPDGTLSSRWLAPEELEQSNGRIAEGQEEIHNGQPPITDENAQPAAVDNVQQEQPAQMEQPIQEATQQTVQTEQASQPQQTEASVQEQTALSRIPVDEKGKPVYDKAEPDLAWDAIMEKTDGDEEMAKNVVDAMVKQQETEVDKLKKKQPKATPGDVDSMIAAQKEKKAAIAAAEERLEQWRKIADTPNRRAAAAKVQPTQNPSDETLTRPETAIAPTENTGNVEPTTTGNGQTTEQGGEVPAGVQGTVEDGAIPERTSEDRQEGGSVPVRTEEVESATEGLTNEDADNLLSAMEARAEAAPDIELTPTNWVEQFGEDGMVETPIGKVKMGENQIAKLFSKGRSSQFGMIRPTLTEPDVVVEVPSSLTEETNNDVERPTSLLFIKAFLKNDGSKVYYFKSVTVKKDGLEVSVSSHLDRKKRVEDALIKGKLLYRFDGGAQTEHRPADVSVTTPLAGQGASSKGNATIGDQSVSDMENGTLVSPQLASSESKDTESSSNEQTVGEKIAQEEAKVEQNPTEAQKEAGNYKKGHVKIDGYDVTIENPKGSVRSGVDRNGQEWSVTMNNTYGYIRGTEGVDGDHIDVFLSDDPTQGDVYVIDQVNEDGSFDEHKAMYGFKSALAAKRAYLANYSPGWKGLGTITKVSKEEFKKWINSSHRKTKPFAEYKSVNKDGAQNEGYSTDGGVRFREMEDDGNKSLVGVHNITEDKLVKAIRQGGLANPSVAVIDADRQTHEGYGEISLIMPSNKINRRTGHNAGTFTNDAWTPMYPPIERQFGKGGSERAAQDIASVAEEMRSEVRQGINSWMDGRNGIGLEYLFLHERNEAPLTVRVEPVYPERLRNEVAEIMNGKDSFMDLDEAEKQSIVNLLVRERYDGDSAKYTDEIKQRIKHDEERIAKRPNSLFSRRVKMDVDFMKEYGYDYSEAKSFVDAIVEDGRTAGTTDTRATLTAAQSAIAERGLQEEYDKWLDGLNDRYNINEVIFDGFTPSGNRRYVPNTLEYVSRLMKKNGRNGATGLGTSFSNFAASVLKAKGTLNDIRKMKGNLTSEHKNVDEFREKWGNVFYELGNKLQPDATGFEDYGLARLAEAATQKKPRKYIKDEYGIEMSDDDVKKLDDMIRAIRENYPAMYFETKFERPVYFNEFTAAVVPNNIKPSTRKTLEDAGLKLFEYDPNMEGDRQRIFNEATREEGVRFRSDENLFNYDGLLTRNGIDAAVADTANKLNIGVMVAHSVDEVSDEGVRRAIEKGRNVKGWYDTRTGEIVVYAPNATDADDAVRTVLHEGVAHYGLRQLVGDENFDTFLDNIYNNVDGEIKAAIDEKAQRNGWSTRVATEEYLASLAEDTNFEAARSSGLWQRIKDFFMDLLTKAGIRLNEALTDNELRYILWRSYENLQEPNGRDIIGTVRDVAMQGRLGVGNYGNEDMRLRETEDEQTPEKKSKNKYRELYDKRVSRRRARLNRSYFDSMQPVKVLQKTITEETGQQIRPEENVYLQENRANSMAQRKHEMWERGHMEPARREVTKLMQQIMGGNWLTGRFKLPKTRRNAYNAVVRYMKSKHGLENNEYRRNMEAEAAREPFEAEIGAVEKLVKDGNISRAEADKRQAELQEQADKAETESRAKTLNKDYSGLQGIYGKDFERKAKEYVEDFEGAYDTAPLWREWNGATKAILEEEYKSGLLSKELYDRIRNMYKYYIPLKGWAENRAEDVYTYYATGSGDGGKPHRREGRTSESDDPLVTLEQDADRQFTAAARNRTKQALYNLATAHKSSLLTVRRQWYQNMGTKENPDWQRKDPEIPENATPEQMEQIIKDFEKDMRKLEKEGTAMRQKKPMIQPYHATKSMEKEHTVRVMVNGKEYVIYVNGNPAAAQAVNGTSTPQDPDGSVLKRIYGALRWINRVKASLLTAVNVNFIPGNLVRDAQYSIQNMKAKEPVDYVLKYVKNLGEGMAKMTSARLFYKDKKGTLNMDDKTERLFKEFLDNGGETGYTARYTLEKQRRRNMAAINRMTGIDWLAGLRMLQHSLEYVNRSVETIVRFAAYKTSREAGRSIAQSINDAKEASVNFDKHGSGELGNKEWRLAYIFSNVGFQALRRLLENASGHPVRFTLAQIERLALGFAVPMMAKAMLDAYGDDDEKDAYEALPEWMRESGLAVPVSPILRKVGADDAADKVKRVFLYLPLGPEDKIWYALGENTWHLFNKDNITVEEAMDMAVKFGSLAADLLPLDFQGYGGNPIVSLAPTPVQDFVALEQNVNYWGQPIYRESTNYNEHDPGHRLAFTGTPEWYVERAEDINRLTGGDEYTKGWLSPKPEQIEYFINQTGGGVTRVVNQVMSLIERSGEDGNKDIQVLKNVPVVSSLVKKADVQDGKDGFDREKYYDYIDEYEKALHDYNAYRKAKRNGDDEAGQKAEKLKESPTGERMDIIRKDIRKIRNKDKQVRRIDEKENPTAKEEARRDKLKTESNELKQKLLEKLDKVKEKPGKQ